MQQSEKAIREMLIDGLTSKPELSKSPSTMFGFGILMNAKLISAESASVTPRPFTSQ